MLPPAGKSGETSVRSNGTITDEMVMDPQCNVYIPRKEAITAKVAGETIYFCSKECKKKYLEEQRHKN
jgi:YHS domain-containing protein